VFDPERAVALDAELSWFATLLGPVRDLHVLERHLTGALAGLSEGVDVAAAAAVIESRLELDEAAARGTLKVALSSARYDRLLSTLDDWQANPPLVRADRHATEVMGYVGAAERKVSRRLRRAPRSDNPDEAFHRARKAGKRARYAAEVSRPVFGAVAKRRIKQAKRLQNDLGEMQDSVVAQEFLQVLASDPETPGAAGFVLGLLWAHEQWRQEKALHHVG